MGSTILTSYDGAPSNIAGKHTCACARQTCHANVSSTFVRAARSRTHTSVPVPSTRTARTMVENAPAAMGPWHVMRYSSKRAQEQTPSEAASVVWARRGHTEDVAPCCSSREHIVVCSAA